MSHCNFLALNFVRTSAEIVHHRLILAQAGVDYEDERIERDAWMSLKPSERKKMSFFSFFSHIFPLFAIFQTLHVVSCLY